MDAVLLTWRWQNILSIWIMVIGLALLITIGTQVFKRMSGNASDQG